MRVIAVMVAFAILFSGLAGISQAQDDELILRVAMQDDLKTTNPLTAGDVWTWNVIGYLYDGPMNTNPDTDELIPYIAIGSASTLDDGIIDWTDCNIGDFDYTPNSTWNSTIGEAIIFYDFEDVYWHDGEQMDIRDIMFSMHVTAQVPEWSSSTNCLKDNGGKEGTNYSATSWLSIQKVWESEDKLQAALKFMLTEPYYDFFRGTLSTFLLPEHIWAYKVSGQNVDGAKIWCDAGYDPDADDAWQVDLAQAYDNEHPIGNGPFEWDHWEVGQISKITTFRDHFYDERFKYEEYCIDADGRSLARQPNIDAIVYKIYKTAEAAVLALWNDDIDYIAWSVPPTFVQELANEPGVALQQSPEQGFFYLSYNMRRQSFGYNESASFPYAPEDDFGKPLRQAIAHCIDRERIVQRLLLNFGIPGNGPVSSISDWYNESLPTYDFDPEKAISILENAGYILDDPSRPPGSTNHWNNPDGSEIGSGENGLIRLIGPYSDWDPRRGGIVIMIANQLQNIGLYVEANVMDFGSIVDIADNRNFDMYILGWRIGSDPTDFLHAFFHSSNAESGQNYPGYQNESFDEIIDLARQTNDSEIKKKAIFDAQASICYDLPYDVLYFRVNIEAYRSDRFTGWVVGDTGSIFNWQSIMNIRAPSPYKVNAQFVSPPSAIVSNSTTQITVFVKDQDGNPLEGAHVILDASSGTLGATEGDTTSSGKFTTTFTAPYVDPNDNDAVNNGSQVTIQIKTATYWSGDTEYDPAPSRLTLITVYPEEVPFLNVKMSADPDVIDPDISSDGQTFGFTYIEVEVTDENGDPVQGATVSVSVSPAIPTLTPTHDTTDLDGKVTFTITATDLQNDDGSIAEYLVTASAEYTRDLNFKPGDNSINVYIVDDDSWPPPPPPPPPKFIYWNEAIMICCGMFIAMIIIVIFGRRP